MLLTSLEQFKKYMQSETYNLTDNGKCTQCGKCCGSTLPMTQTEIDTIHGHIKKYNIKECKNKTPLAQLVLYMICPFLDESKKSKKCKIYEVRPEICKKFICDPAQRVQIDISHAAQARIVDVRKEFF